jgi:lysine/ornithine N-monooxygenase
VKRDDGRLDVTLVNSSTGQTSVETYDTVLFATGTTHRHV